MSTLTVYSDAADGYMRATGATWAAACAGTTIDTVDTTGTALYTGDIFASPTYYLYEGFFSFDTSSIGAGQQVTAVTFSLFCGATPGNTSGTTEVRSYDWGTSLTSADWVNAATFSAASRLATFANSGVTGGVYNNFTEDGTNFRNAINPTGSTRFVVTMDSLATGTPPGSGQFRNTQWVSADQAGTSIDPKLVVTYSPAALTKQLAALGVG